MIWVVIGVAIVAVIIKTVVNIISPPDPGVTITIRIK